MPQIEYAHFTEGTQTLHLVRPTGSGDVNTQYVLIFEGRENATVKLIFGDLEFNSTLGCLAAGADLLTHWSETAYPHFNTPIQVKRRARRGCMFDVSTLEVIKDEVSRDGLHELRLGLKPYIEAISRGTGAQYESTLPTTQLRIQRNEEELRSLGKIFGRLKDADFRPILTSTSSHWFVPPELEPRSDLQELSLPARTNEAVKYISAVSPPQLSRHWSRFLKESIWLQSSQCTVCDGYFSVEPDEASWRKKCYGCYKKQKSTAWTKEQIKQDSHIEPWLSRLPEC